MTHKYGIEMPTSISHAKKIDEANGNHFWREAIAKEMTNVGWHLRCYPQGNKLQ